MKYCDIIKEYIGKEGVVYGDEVDGFSFKPPGSVGYEGKLMDVGEDFVFFEVMGGSFKGQWYCPISRFFLKP